MFMGRYGFMEWSLRYPKAQRKLCLLPNFVPGPLKNNKTEPRLIICVKLILNQRNKPLLSPAVSALISLYGKYLNFLI